MKYVYYNGEIVLEKNAKIDFNDLGFSRGYGVFDALRTVQGEPFLLKEHFQRLKKSAEHLNMKMAITQDEFKIIIDKLLQKNKIGSKFSEEVFVKTIITGGVSSNGLEMTGRPTILIFIGDLKKVMPKKQLYKTGGKIITLEFQRFLSEAKTLNYIMAVKNQKKKIKAGATEIVYYNKGLVLEGATSNVFVVKNNQVITPGKNILLGTMRNFIIDLLRKNNFSWKVRRVKLSELFSADEVFLTGSFKGVLPIVEGDDKIIGDGKVGNITKLIMDSVDEICNFYTSF